ncbi:hypothetical protein BDW02DRAFT_596889 [Decorospora gaudefroyi]|uniref:Uncharacterized protein n=1 Tax=Decorospora gaudefroyi TaxID=184978 RepID=A0A6A5KJU4_9PLEO|nr:hypothetical protein BDW02DRAFT_596889 [Decorospora gaudefroyi]
MTRMMVMVDTVSKGLNPMEKGGVDVTPFDDSILQPVTRTLREFIKVSAMSNEFEHGKSQVDDAYLIQILSLANRHLNIFAVPHLYNTMPQLNLLKDKWTVIDRIIEMHMKALFADASPTKTADIADRLLYRMNFYTTQKIWYQDKKWKLKDPTASQLLSDTHKTGSWHIADQANNSTKHKHSSSIQRLKVRPTSISHPRTTCPPHQRHSTPFPDVSTDSIRLSHKAILPSPRRRLQMLELFKKTLKNSGNEFKFPLRFMNTSDPCDD